MTDRRQLRTQVGTVLRRRRERDRLTQAELAARAGTAQSTVARVERGTRSADVDLLERLFAALGCQVRLDLEPLDKETLETMATLARVPLRERVATAGIPKLSADLEPIPHVFTGATAALLQGAPVPVTTLEIALARADCDAFTRWLGRRYAHRWHASYQEFGYAPLDPRRPGEMLWRIIGNVTIRVDLGDELPACLTVRHGEREYRVVPLAEIEVSDPDTARLLHRYRDRVAAARQPSPGRTSPVS